MGEVKEINIKDQTYYFYSGMINIKSFDPVMLKINRNHIKALLFTTLIYSN